MSWPNETVWHVTAAAEGNAGSSGPAARDLRPLATRSARGNGYGMKGFMHRSAVTRAERAKLAEELTELGLAPGRTERACCCPARPAVRVIMPATACRPDPIDLLLCGHHYRASQTALQAAGAAVYDNEGVLIMGTAGRRQPHRHQTAATA